MLVKRILNNPNYNEYLIKTNRFNKSIDVDLHIF